MSNFQGDKENLKIFDKEGNEIALNAYIQSGFKICAVDSEGNILETLTIIVAGDIDGDGEAATPLDAMILARYLAEWDGYAGMIDENASDLDGDGVITLRDAVILVRFIAGWPEFTVLPYTP